MFDPTYYIRSRSEELRREAERYRLIALARQGAPARTALHHRLLNWWGGRLCQWGKLLQQKFGDCETITHSNHVKNFT